MRTSRWLIPTVCLLIVGCSMAARDRVMHFFFEIPDNAGDNDGTTVASSSKSAQPAEPQLELPETRFRSQHKPYMTRMCAECHNQEERMEVRGDFLQQCRTCHTKYFSEAIEHPPVADEECMACHQPHRSVEPFLLRQSVLDTCVDCHDEPEDLSEDVHGAEGVENCISCHDPHFSTGVMLRADYKRTDADDS